MGRATLAAGLLAAQAPLAAPLAAQTDFYDLDKARPLRVEDAYAIKRWAFELQASPLALSQDRSGAVRYAPGLELKHGLLPGAEVSVGTHLELDRSEGETAIALGAFELSSLVNLWVESRTFPAMAVRATGHLASRSAQEGWIELRGLATRGVAGRVRAHLTGAWLGGGGRPEDWWFGLALDYVLPFQHTLLLAETWVARPSEAGESATRRLQSTLGLRRQLSPTLTLDAGVGRGWRGAERDDWLLTLGLSHEFALRAVMPGSGR